MTCAASTPPRRSRAVFFHQGAPQLSAGVLRTGQGIARLGRRASSWLVWAGGRGLFPDGASCVHVIVSLDLGSGGRVP